MSLDAKLITAAREEMGTMRVRRRTERYLMIVEDRTWKIGARRSAMKSVLDPNVWSLLRHPVGDHWICKQRAGAGSPSRAAEVAELSTTQASSKFSHILPNSRDFDSLRDMITATFQFHHSLALVACLITCFSSGGH